MPNRGVNPAVGSPMVWGGLLLLSQEERKSGVNAAFALNLRIEKKPLAGVDACGLGLPARGWDQENQMFFCREAW